MPTKKADKYGYWWDENRCADHICPDCSERFLVAEYTGWLDVRRCIDCQAKYKEYGFMRAREGKGRTGRRAR